LLTFLSIGKIENHMPTKQHHHQQCAAAFLRTYVAIYDTLAPSRNQANYHQGRTDSQQDNRVLRRKTDQTERQEEDAAKHGTLRDAFDIYSPASPSRFCPHHCC
jgi:hypothetical protein